MPAVQTQSMMSSPDPYGLLAYGAVIDLFAVCCAELAIAHDAAVKRNLVLALPPPPEGRLLAGVA